MHYILLFAILLANCQQNSKIIELTDATIESHIANNQIVIILYYAPWCGQCKAFMPEFQILANEVQNTSYKIAQIDATEHQENAYKHHISGYPTIILFLSGNAIIYPLQKNAVTLKKWIEAKINQAWGTLKSENEIKELSQSPIPSIVLIAMPGDNESINAFKQVMWNTNGYNYYLLSTTKPILLIKSKPSFVLIKNYDNPFSIYDNDLNTSSIINFIVEQSRRIISNFTTDIANEIFVNNRNALIAFVNTKNMENVSSQLYSIASKYKKEFLFTISDIKEDIQEKLANLMNIKEEDLPLTMLITHKNNKIIKYKNKLMDVVNIEEFILQAMEGKLQPFYKSEQEPTKNTGPIIKLVGSNFKEQVMTSNKDVLVKFGAPWCAHCKEFDSVYLSIAQRLSDNANANIMLAEMDAHLNEVEGVDIKEYPTVLLYTRKNKANPVLYEGERTEEKILLFLQENIDYIVKTTKPKKDL